MRVIGLRDQCAAKPTNIKLLPAAPPDPSFLSLLHLELFTSLSVFMCCCYCKVCKLGATQKDAHPKPEEAHKRQDHISHTVEVENDDIKKTSATLLCWSAAVHSQRGFGIVFWRRSASVQFLAP